MEQEQGLDAARLIQFAAAKLDVKVEERDWLVADDNGQVKAGTIWFELGVYMEDQPFELSDFDIFCRGMRAFRTSGASFMLMWNCACLDSVVVLDVNECAGSHGLENIQDLPEAFWKAWLDLEVRTGKIIPEKMP